MERRTLLRAGLASLLALVGAGTLSSGCSKEKKPTSTPVGTDDDQAIGVLDLNDETYAALREIGGTMKVNLAGVSNPVLVIRTAQDQVRALSVVCTHAGCEIGLPTNNEIVCPCHGSKFDLDGSVIQGPATQALPSYPAEIQNQKIYITT